MTNGTHHRRSDVEKLRKIKAQMWLIFPILAWSSILLVSSILDVFYVAIQTWPGFLASVIMWYVQEYYFNLVLLYWTSLEFAFARWIFVNFNQRMQREEIASDLDQQVAGGSKSLSQKELPATTSINTH